MPILLIAVVLIPALFGALRLVELAEGPELMPDQPGIDSSPVPVVGHIVSAVGDAVLGAFLFSTHVRRRWPRWHRPALAQGFASAAFDSGEHVRNPSLRAGWVLNLAIAEYVVGRVGRGHGLSQRLTGPETRAR